MKEREKRSLQEDGKILVRGIRIWAEISPQFMVYNILRQIAERLLPYFPLYMTTQFVNELSAACREKRLLTLAAATVFGTFFLSVGKRILDGRVEVWKDVCLQKTELYMAQRQNEMEYRHMEDSKAALLREEIFNASRTGGSGLWRIIWCLPNLIGSLFDLALSASLTCSMFRVVNLEREGNGFLSFVNSPGCAAAFLFLLGLSSALSIKTAGIHTAREMDAWSVFAKDMLSVRTYLQLRGEDITIFNLKDLILKEYEKAALQSGCFAEVERIHIRYDSLDILLKAALSIAVFLITAGKAFVGVFGIGSFILYRGSVSRFVEALSGIAENYAHLRENNKYLLRLYEFLDRPGGMYCGSLAVEKRDDIDYEIEFRNVSFQYPGSDGWALKNVSMKFKIGEKLAIVGQNGSGKTTFIKLLCRLYDPTDGTILLNGIDISKYRPDEYRSLFSVVFQDFALFPFSLAENVAGRADYDEKKVEECLNRAGFGERLGTMDDGIRTVIGRDFEDDGIDLSGGEQQKVALARALYKDGPFMVLDEPTAALDPIAEAAVYEGFWRMVRDKTAVFISHRLSSCRFCDEIIVFHKGQLVQRGDHDTLAKQEGMYRQLWEAQAKYYV